MRQPYERQGNLAQNAKVGDGGGGRTSLPVVSGHWAGLDNNVIRVTLAPPFRLNSVP